MVNHTGKPRQLCGLCGARMKALPKPISLLAPVSCGLG